MKSLKDKHPLKAPSRPKYLSSISAILEDDCQWRDKEHHERILKVILDRLKINLFFAQIN